MVEPQHRVACAEDVTSSQREALASPAVDNVLHLAAAARRTQSRGRVPAPRDRAGRGAHGGDERGDLHREDQMASAEDCRVPALLAKEDVKQVVGADDGPDQNHVAGGKEELSSASKAPSRRLFPVAL